MREPETDPAGDLNDVDAEGRVGGESEGGGDGSRSFVVRCEEIFFALIIGAFLIAGLLPIISRSFELTAFSWASPLSKQLVLWVALFGAGAATRDRKHITIDAVGQFLPARRRLALRAFTQLLAAIICGVLVWVSILFVLGEAEFAGDTLSPFGVPIPWLQSIIPLGFVLLTIRLLLAAAVDAKAALNSPKETEKR